MNTYSQEDNSKSYKQLNRLVIAKLTSHPDERTLAQIPTLSDYQIIRAARFVFYLQDKLGTRYK